MMRRALSIVGLGGLVVLFAAVAGATPEDQLLAEYAANVRLYRTGDRRQAVQALRSQPGAVLELAGRAFMSARGRQTFGVSEQDLAAAALLHTDLALQAPDPAREGMLDTAEALLVRAEGTDKSARHCLWLQAIGLFHHHRMELGPATARFKRASLLCADDADAWALLAQAYEAGESSKPRDSKETPAASVGTTETRKLDGSNRPVVVENTMEEAERAYRRAIAASTAARPDLRLHLARCRQALGKREDAQRELESILSDATDPAITYVANLLLGGLYETQGSFSDAIRFYRAALQAAPRSQIATVALSHALHRSGHRRESTRVVEAWAKQSREGMAPPAEAWWVFTWGPAVMPAPEEALLSSLRRELAR